MRLRTEDLLSLRDGEPVDAAVKALLNDDPAAAKAVAALARRRRALTELPELEPPAQLRERVLAEMGAAAGERRSLRLRGFALAASAGAFAAAAIWLAVELTLPAADDAPARSAAAPAPPPVAEDYVALVRESARLEGLLVALPAQRDVMTASTAGTIASLEDQIALIDSQLTQASAVGVDDGYRSTLWRERVNVMSALLQVRYAQSQLFAF